MKNKNKMKQAIKKSIEVWKERTKPEFYTGVGKTIYCPLCEYDIRRYQKLSYDRKSIIEACWFCPIYKLTNKTGCRGTPYVDWINMKKKKNIETAIILAKEMVGMLECLLDYDEHVKILKEDGSLNWFRDFNP